MTWMRLAVWKRESLVVPASIGSHWRRKRTADARLAPKRRGRRIADYATVQREAALAADWERARDAGTYKADFAKQNGLTVKQLDALLDRVAKRKRISE